MFPILNNKSLLDCKEEDLQFLLNNEDYREGQHIDYKNTFSFLKADKERRAAELVEYRNLICSFANADGGYVLYGVEETKGVPTEIVGVEIPNTDKFELELRNHLSAIEPRIPHIQFGFIKLKSGRYVVAIKIEHDYYAPYTQLEDQKNYKFYKRDGNEKKPIKYAELKNMFIQSRALEADILEFRKKRIRFRGDQETSKEYVLFHIIPESFLNERQPLFLIEKAEHNSYRSVFSGTPIESLSIPCVDGLRYVDWHTGCEGVVFINGIVELYLPMDIYGNAYPTNDSFDTDKAWRNISYVMQGYQRNLVSIFGNQRYFGCVSIIGFKGALSERREPPDKDVLIDRDELICSPVLFSAINNKEIYDLDMKRQHLELLLSIGVKHSKDVEGLARDIMKWDALEKTGEECGGTNQ